MTPICARCKVHNAESASAYCNRCSILLDTPGRGTSLTLSNIPYTSREYRALDDSK